MTTAMLILYRSTNQTPASGSLKQETRVLVDPALASFSWPSTDKTLGMHGRGDAATWQILDKAGGRICEKPPFIKED